MCYTCGCSMPFNDMGDPKNITEKHFEEAGKTDAIVNAGTLMAKKNTISLLQKEIQKEELETPQKQY